MARQQTGTTDDDRWQVLGRNSRAKPSDLVGGKNATIPACGHNPGSHLSVQLVGAEPFGEFGSVLAVLCHKLLDVFPTSEQIILHQLQLCGVGREARLKRWPKDLSKGPREDLLSRIFVLCHAKTSSHRANTGNVAVAVCERRVRTFLRML